MSKVPTLYSIGTPNGQRITILLELLNVQHEYKRVDIFKGEQTTPEFTKLNPYNKIPVLIDTNPITDESLTLFEAGAITLFLVNKYDVDNVYHYPENSPLYYEQLKWFFFATTSLISEQVPLVFFTLFASKKDEFAKGKYLNETQRVYDVLNKRLIENDGWLVGDRLNIVDVTIYPHAKIVNILGLNLVNDFPKVQEWIEKLDKLESIQKGLAIDPL